MTPAPHPEVALVAWPHDDALRRQLAAARRPRVLLIADQQAAPLAGDEFEDWVRFPLDPDELAVRIATLTERAREVPPRPPALRLDDDRVLHADERWVALAPLEAAVLALLLEHPGRVVRRPALVHRAWPAGPPADPRAVDGVVKRLRRRIHPLGVRIHTLTAQGFLLDYAPADASTARSSSGASAPGLAEGTNSPLAEAGLVS